MSYRYTTFGHPGMILLGVLFFFAVCFGTAFVFVVMAL